MYHLCMYAQAMCISPPLPPLSPMSCFGESAALFSFIYVPADCVINNKNWIELILVNEMNDPHHEIINKYFKVLLWNTYLIWTTLS